MLVYMAIYVVMKCRHLRLHPVDERDGQAVTDIRALNMYSKSDPLKALAVLVLMFSLAGVPPLVGFFGKFYVLRAAVEGGMAWLAVAGVIASVIGGLLLPAHRLLHVFRRGLDSRAPPNGRARPRRPSLGPIRRETSPRPWCCSPTTRPRGWRCAASPRRSPLPRRWRH
jgi:formate hydrogenlyase subunit 3/multisubunit Na+/H+ antiporter MnhD subunit